MSVLANATRRALFRRIGLGALSTPIAGAMLKRAVGAEASRTVLGDVMLDGQAGIPVALSSEGADRGFLRQLAEGRERLADTYYSRNAHRRGISQAHYDSLISVSPTTKLVWARRHEQAERERNRSWAESLLRTLPFMKEGDR